MHSRSLLFIAAIMLMASTPGAALAQQVHVWQEQELTFTSERTLRNAYGPET